jgi:hypothetical protein
MVRTFALEVPSLTNSGRRLDFASYLDAIVRSLLPSAPLHLPFSFVFVLPEADGVVQAVNGSECGRLQRDLLRVKPKLRPEEVGDLHIAEVLKV